MPVEVRSEARRRGTRAAQVRRDARTILEVMGEAGSELTVSLVGDETMRELNRRYRKRDAPTDVLAFSMREGTRAAGDEALLGDVVISLDTAARQARGRRRPVETEVRTLLIHGVLHLLGYDHERSTTAARRMRQMEDRLARRLRRGRRE